MSTNNRGIGQLDLSLLETSAEGLKFSRKNIEAFLNNLKVVAESLEIRSSQSYNKDMAFESINDLNSSFQYNPNDEPIVGIESLNLYDKDNSFDDNKNVTPQRNGYKKSRNGIHDIQNSSSTPSSPKPPVSPRSIKESKIISEINVFLKSPRKMEDEFDEATVVRQFSQIAQCTAEESKENIRSLSSKISYLNNSYETIDNNVIPSFYFPYGRPLQYSDVTQLSNTIEQVFKRFPEKAIQAKDFGQVCAAIGKPNMWSRILVNGCLGKDASDNDVVSYEVFRTYWLELTSECFDDASIFIRLLVDGASSDSDSAPRRKYLVAEDFRPLISHVIHTIRDLDVLKNAPIFHSIYIDTVITRIFWRVSRTWLNKITAGELRKSNFLDVYGSLDKMENINDEHYFFSYIHFYVIYCKFWELDEDHDMMITPEDFVRYSDGALPSRVIDRIFKVNKYLKKYPKNSEVPESLDYSDFTLFLLADENKRQNKSLEYWFRILDINGDGRLSFDEMVHFHEEVIRNVRI
uniref:EF-hand domain-containing protein n=1 Tax=Strongyloides papillosus TaxID=174720 RepID=A0A0N5C9N1_STREA